MRNSTENKPSENNGENGNHTIIHPDLPWIKQIIGWKLCGTLSFRYRFLDTQNDKVKDLFARYNWHLTGEYNFKNVPVYWKWEFDNNDRLHCHFVLLETHPEFDWLRGSEHSFANAVELANWLKGNWKHGISHFTGYRDAGWLEYITKQNTLMNSCFTPPIHYLKRQVQEGKPGCFFPDYYGVNSNRPQTNEISASGVSSCATLADGNGAERSLTE